MTWRTAQTTSNYGRYGYRRVTATPYDSGLAVSKDRAQCICRRTWLRVPQNSPSARVFGSVTGHVSGSDRNNQVTP